jgi:hypothetical protein
MLRGNSACYQAALNTQAERDKTNMFPSYQTGTNSGQPIRLNDFSLVLCITQNVLDPRARESLLQAEAPLAQVAWHR